MAVPEEAPIKIVNRHDFWGMNFDDSPLAIGIRETDGIPMPSYCRKGLNPLCHDVAQVLEIATTDDIGIVCCFAEDGQRSRTKSAV